MTDWVARLSGVCKDFKGIPLLKDVDLELPSGASVGLVGPNGSGKSVLMKILLGFERPDAGSRDINPRYLDRARRFPERFGVIIDRPGFIGGETGLANMRELAAIRGAAGEGEIRYWMEVFDLDPSLRTPVRNYSLGMRQRLALVQAFMEKPDVLVLDEPFNALDSTTVEVLHEQLKAFAGAGGTLLMTSHDRSDIDRRCDAIYRIDRGTLVLEASG